ncbi:amidohydrolase family protein [Phytoactinopolyspora endophytica]|uniref:amidohydrolase family protein n=1 Tax=Phytoactinopolyspora endophytica TaxID=1642495 RepID=UPI00101CD70F|nr:amidohydrolase family protein [Phytoactinopolyspora endophytica]
MSTDAAERDELADLVASTPLTDHHVHGAIAADLSPSAFEAALTESDRPAPSGLSTFDSSLGFAVRRWCAPLLDLDPHASGPEYTARRLELGHETVNRRFLAGSGVTHYLVETGHHTDHLLDPGGLSRLCGIRTSEVVRLESVAEELAASDVAASNFARLFDEALAARAASAVGLKTIVAYRAGLDVDPTRPSPAQVTAAAGSWLREIRAGAPARLTDPVLLRHLIWAGVDTGLPLQIHTGIGDPDLRLHRANPLLLTEFIEASEGSGAPLLLLHCYPYHRQAAYLSHAYPHVYVDVGLAVTFTGAAATTVVAELLELAPFGKVLYSSDAWGLSELHFLGSVQWRSALRSIITTRVTAGDWSLDDATRLVRMVSEENAARVYRLGGTEGSLS